jgi:hypothetical protein
MACRIRRPKRPQQRNDHGENDVTGFDDPEMQDLLGLAARLGRDPLVVQGPGGNFSLKRDGVMWVKASDTWMMEATSRSILIPVDFVAVLNGLAAGDPRRWGCQRCACRPAFIIICPSRSCCDSATDVAAFRISL